MGKSDEQIQRESDKKIARATTKALPPVNRKGHGVADWANANPEDVLRLVCAVASEGGAVRLGYTRDGGAYSIGLYLGADSKTYYCNDAEGIVDYVNELRQNFE